MNSLKLKNLPGLLYVTEEFMHNGDHDILLFTLVSSELTESNLMVYRIPTLFIFYGGNTVVLLFRDKDP